MRKRSILIYILALMPLVVAFSQDNRESKEQITQEADYLEALVDLQIGKLDDGIQKLDKLYKSDRTNAPIAYDLARAYAEKGDFTMTEKFAKSAIKNEPSNQWYQLFFGDYLLDNNRPGYSSDIFNELIILDPSNELYYNKLADAYVLQDDVKKAIKTYDRYEEANGFRKATNMKRFELYDLIGDYGNASAQLEELQRKFPQDKIYFKLAASLHLKNDQKTKAKNTYSKVLKIDPNDTEANLSMIDDADNEVATNSYLRALIPIITNKSIDINGKVKELIPYVQKLAQGSDPKLGPALKDIGLKLINTHPDEAKAHAIYGDILMSIGETQNAIDQYDVTLGLDDRVFAVWEQLMFALDNEMNYSELLSRSEESIDLFPNQPMSYFFYARSLAQSNEAEEALSIAQEGQMISGKNQTFLSMMGVALANAYIAQGKFKKANLEIEKSLEISKNQNAFAFEALGDLHDKNGKKKEALKAYEAAQNLGFNNLRIQSKIKNASI